nr:PH108-3-56 [Vibrio phage 1]
MTFEVERFLLGVHHKERRKISGCHCVASYVVERSKLKRMFCPASPSCIVTVSARSI